MKLLADTVPVPSVFGTINPPAQLKPFIDKGGAGAGGISLFLNNLISLIYILASIIFVFMIVWGALEWLTSGGDKEKVSKAQQKLTNAVVGMLVVVISLTVFSVVTGNVLGIIINCPHPKLCPTETGWKLVIPTLR